MTFVGESKAILLMFLGGFPYDDRNDCDRHWFNFFTTKTTTLNIVIHPLSILNNDANFLKLKKTIANNAPLKEMYDDGKLLIVDEAHHMKTKWATFSLVGATLLMMQYALSQKGNIFKKMVLIDSTHGPLYRYDVIEQELSSDYKSWFYFGSDNEGYHKDMFKKMYDYEGGIFSINDVTYMSQWFALDQSHLSFFFDLNTPNYITYVKSGEVECTKGDTKVIDIIQSISNNPKYQKFIESHVGSGENKLSTKQNRSEFEGDIFKTGYCITGDESYFGAVFKYHFKTNEDFLENIKYNTISNLNTNIVKQIITPNSGEDQYLDGKLIYVNHVKPKDKKQYTENYGGWYGSTPKFNKLNLKYRVYVQLNKHFDTKKPESKDNSKYLIVKNGHIHGVTEEMYQQLTGRDDIALKVYRTLDGGSKENETIINIEDTETKFNHNIFEKKYTVSSTFTDWSVVSVNPANMTRSLLTCFFHKDFDEKNAGDFTSKSFFHRPPIDVITDTTISTRKFIDDLLKQAPMLTTNMTKTNYVAGPGYHPLEYGTYTLKELINTYNLIEFFSLTKPDLKFFREFCQAKLIYKSIIDQNMQNIDVYEGKYFILKDGSGQLGSQCYGYPVTSHALNNALHYGALFIRKVLKTSKIDEYSNKLFAIDKYVLEDNLTSYGDRAAKYKSLFSFARGEFVDPVSSDQNKYQILKQMYVDSMKRRQDLSSKKLIF